MIYLFFFILIAVRCIRQQESFAFCDEQMEFNISFYGKLISNVKLSNSTDAILADNRVIIIDNELNVLSSVQIPKSVTHKCEWIFKPISDIFFVGCQKNEEAPYLIAYKSINDTHFSQFGDIEYFPNFNETILKVTGIQNTLFIIQKTKVTLFSLVISAQDWGIKITQYVLDKKYFGRTTEINITDITYEPFIEDNELFYKLIVVEYDLGAFWLDALSNNNILTPFRTGIINLKAYFNITKYYQSALIHSTTYNTSQITFNLFYNGQLNVQIKATYISTLNTNIVDNFYYSSNNWWSFGQPIKLGNLQGILRRNSQKQSILSVYNVKIPLASDQNLNLQDTPIYDPIDSFISLPQDYSIYYFNKGYRVVYSREDNYLQICDLYNYKLLME
ncbi:unnamed protein product [Paramecium sonneborni]|uniref:Transmembrane protein n=1 Tax=Paramecium sonneborni TaxID=65129 RepID=A0A8S1PH66_9CILI|nr:unnamed protein product [Paramecium sonneborni]